MGQANEKELFEAVESWDFESTSRLLASGVSPNAKTDQGITPLIWALQKKNPRAGFIDLLILHRADPNIKDKNGRNPLHLAIEHGNKAIIEHLIRGNANLNETDEEQKSPLYLAIEQEKMSIVNSLLSGKACVNSTHVDQPNPLHCAVAKQQHKIISALIKGKAMINNLSKNGGQTVLHKALQNEDIRSVELLVNARADVNLQSRQGGTTALHWALPGVVKLLVSQEAVMVNKIDEAGHTPLHHAAKRGCMQCVTMFIDTGAKVDILNKRGQNALHMAALANNHDCIWVLLDANADINKNDGLGRSALYIAAKNSNVKAVNALLEREANVNASIATPRESLIRSLTSPRDSAPNPRINVTSPRNNNFTIPGASKSPRLSASSPQVGATSTRSLRAFNFDDELNNPAASQGPGASINPGSPKLLSPRKSPRVIINPESPRLVSPRKSLKLSGKETALHVTTDVEVLRALLKRGAGFGELDHEGKTGLHRFAQDGQVEVLDEALRLGWGAEAYLNVQCKRFKRTALHYAAKDGFVECVGILSSQGANLNVKDGSKRNALHWACLNNHSACVEELAKAKADLNMTNGVLQTPLHIALENNCIESIKSLLDGTWTSIEDENGNTVVDVAIKQEKLLILRDKNNLGFLHHSCIEGDLESVKKLVNHVDVNSKSDCGLTPVWLAAAYKRAHVVKFLTEQGADLQIPCTQYPSFLKIAGMQTSYYCMFEVGDTALDLLRKSEEDSLHQNCSCINPRLLSMISEPLDSEDTCKICMIQ